MSEHCVVYQPHQNIADYFCGVEWTCSSGLWVSSERTWEQSMWDCAWASITVSSQPKSQVSALWVPVPHLRATLQPHAVVCSVVLPQQSSRTRWHQEQKQSSQFWGPEIHNWGAGRTMHPPEPEEGLPCLFLLLMVPGVLSLLQQCSNLCPCLHLPLAWIPVRSSQQENIKEPL